MSRNEVKNHSEREHIGGILVLVGGILALVFPIFPIFLTLMLRGYVADLLEKLGELLASGSGPALHDMASALLLFILIGAIATIVFGSITIYAYTWIRRGRAKSGGMAAILTGVAMIATLHWIPGLFAVVGGVLCYRAKPTSATSE
jgi:uncharacterized membrane protein YidH (DUF202 family)